jgi:hypothetical protein
MFKKVDVLVSNRPNGSAVGPLRYMGNILAQPI